MMLVDDDAIPAQFVRSLHLIKVAIVEPMPFDGIINGIGQRDPCRVILFVKIFWQVRPGHKVEVVELQLVHLRDSPVRWQLDTHEGCPYISSPKKSLIA